MGCCFNVPKTKLNPLLDIPDVPDIPEYVFVPDNLEDDILESPDYTPPVDNDV